SGLDLDADPIVRIVDPAGPARPSHRKPCVPDHGKEDITARDPLGQDPAEVRPQGDTINVLEDLEMLSKVFAEPIRLMLAILAPIGNEDSDPVHERRSDECCRSP